MKCIFLGCIIFSVVSVLGQEKPAFTIVPLGVKGGSDERNLSAYMVAAYGTNEYVCLDAGTVYSGISAAVKAKIFKGPPSYILKNYIKGYCISHAHLDHIAGLVINSPEDTSKFIYGLPFCLDIIKDKYFSWKSWANFANEGEKPALNKYVYTYLEEKKEIAVQNTSMFVRPFKLSHSKPYEGTAFLLRRDSSYLLYLGDTGADEVEQSDRLNELWDYITPLIRSRRLKGIFIEASFPDEQPAMQLFGHLTPTLLTSEMKKLAEKTGIAALRNIKVFITHIKPKGENEAIIKAQLRHLNTLQLNLIFPKQAQQIKL